MDEICKCGNEECGKGRFCFNSDKKFIGSDPGSVCLDVIEASSSVTVKTGICKYGQNEY